MHAGGGVDQGDHPALGQDLGTLAGRDPALVASDDAAGLVDASDVLIEFSAPAATAAHVALTAAHGTAHVIGTTGLSEAQEQAIRDAARRTAIVRAANMSLGVNLLLGLTEQVARARTGGVRHRDFEMHHRHKVDAPSGTALALGQAAARGRGVDLTEMAERGRDGMTEAEDWRDRLRRAARRRRGRRSRGDLRRRRRAHRAGAPRDRPPDLCARRGDRGALAARQTGRPVHGRRPRPCASTPMSKQVTVYYALQSPWTYFGWARLRELVAQSGATAHYRPIQIAPVFEASGTLVLAQRPKQRQAYRLMELRRWRDHLGIPQISTPSTSPSTIARGADRDRASPARRRHRRPQSGDDEAVLGQERNLADRATLLEIAQEQGADGPTCWRRRKPAVREEYDANSHAAIDQGVFGMPTFVIDDELFWGQDRLDFVARALGLLPRAGESR